MRTRLLCFFTPPCTLNGVFNKGSTLPDRGQDSSPLRAVADDLAVGTRDEAVLPDVEGLVGLKQRPTPKKERCTDAITTAAPRRGGGRS